MITSIFSKSNPINFIIVFFIMLLAFIIARKEVIEEAITLLFIIKQVILLFICCVSILLLYFIVNKNNLTDRTNYEILLFGLFFLLIGKTTIDSNILISNFLILLGLRRLLSLRSQKNVKKKLFDAAFWIAIAALFYFWSILFFALIIFALFFYSDNDVRHWIIPFLGMATVFVLSVGGSLVLYDSFFELCHIPLKFSYDFSMYNSTQYLVGITLLLSFWIWSSIFYVQRIKKKKKDHRPSFKIIMIAALIAFFIMVQAPRKSGSEFLFLFAPLAIIITNYIETIEERWFKVFFISILVITPFALLAL